ncbi:glutathione S-transferase family protein [Algihabitans albus]|uniref:glutathione S-transferase family protein n=1 Tax=Algihabitans albus TaxID=2164067 RepID=UPI001F1BD80A|nr:glutathione S-transferase family protein [Algihabitans albus]
MSEAQTEITSPKPEAGSSGTPGAMTLVIGNRNYSSWSMRAALVLAMTPAQAKEILIPLDQPETRSQLLAHSPSGLVPVLLHGELLVWDSLAIAEYLHEIFPAAGLWPAERQARAFARAVSAEMHSGFATLRQEMSMDIRASKPRTPSRACQADIDRIAQIWQECRVGFGDGGPFLFGRPSIADCIYAPVASRFRTYGVPLDATCQAYVEALFAWPPMQVWVEAAKIEPWELPDH